MQDCSNSIANALESLQSCTKPSWGLARGTSGQHLPWWRHQIDTFSALLAICAKASDAELWCFLWSAPWIKGWVHNREAGDLRRNRAHYDVIVMTRRIFATTQLWKCKRYSKYRSPHIIFKPQLFPLLSYESVCHFTVYVKCVSIKKLQFTSKHKIFNKYQ